MKHISEILPEVVRGICERQGNDAPPVGTKSHGTAEPGSTKGDAGRGAEGVAGVGKNVHTDSMGA